MRPSTRLPAVWVALATALCIGSPTPVSAQGQAADSAAAVAIVTSFHTALAAGDSASVIELLDPGARIVEGGRVETVDEYRSGHLGADMAYAGGVERTRTTAAVSIHTDVAVVQSTIRTQGTFRDREIDSRGAETMVLVRRDGGWRIAGIHWS